MVQENDATWKFDTLLQEVTQEFNAEAERSAETAKEREALFGNGGANNIETTSRPGGRKRGGA